MLLRSMARTMRSDPPLAPPRAQASRARRAGRGVGAILVGLAMIAVLVGGASLAYYRWCQGSGGAQRPVSFSVAPGATEIETVNAMNDRGIVRCGGTAARVMLGLRGGAPAVEAGADQPTTDMTPRRAAEGFGKGAPPGAGGDGPVPGGVPPAQNARPAAAPPEVTAE